MKIHQTGKNNSDQTYSCPRDWRASATMCAQFSTLPQAPRTSQHYCIEGLKKKGPYYAERR